MAVVVCTYGMAGHHSGGYRKPYVRQMKLERKRSVRATVPLKVHSPNPNKAFHEAAPLKGSNMP